MTLQNIFYFTATFFIVLLIIFLIYLYVMLGKLIAFINMQKLKTKALMLETLKAKYNLQINVIRFFLNLLKGGEKNL